MTLVSLKGGFSGGGGIAHWAHLGGYVGAAVFLVVMDRMSPARSFRTRASGATPPPVTARVLGDRASMERWSRIRAEELHEVNRAELERIRLRIEKDGVASLTRVGPGVPGPVQRAGRRRMKLWHCVNRNFGDALNPWLWNRLLPGFLDRDASTLFVGIGTILDDRVPAEPLKVVFSSGTGYGPPPPARRPVAFLLCARAAHRQPAGAARRSGGDRRGSAPAAGLRRDPAAGAEASPSCRTISASSTTIGRPSAAGSGSPTSIPTRRCPACSNRSRAPKLVLTEAMHGAIVADTLRVPWVAVSIYEHINGVQVGRLVPVDGGILSARARSSAYGQLVAAARPAAEGVPATGRGHRVAGAHGPRGPAGEPAGRGRADGGPACRGPGSRGAAPERRPCACREDRAAAGATERCCA